MDSLRSCKMLMSLWTCLLLHVTCICSTAHRLRLQTTERYPNGILDDLRAYPREKRAVSLAKIGIKALQQLLTGSKTIPSKSMRHRRYLKEGDFETAKEDFYSIRPKNVKTYLGQNHVHQVGSIITGNKGDRRLILNKYGEKGYPVLEVIETKFAPGQYVDRIIYKPRKKVEKRAIPVTLAAKGLAALNKILDGSIKLRSYGKRHRRHQKQGDFETAKADFYAANPHNVRTGTEFHWQKPGTVLTGSVGDRRLIVRKNGEKGYPILEVVETAMKPGRYVDRIIYKKGNN